MPLDAHWVPLAIRRPLVRIPDFALLPADARAAFVAIDREADQLLQRMSGAAETAWLDGSIPPPACTIRNIHHSLAPLFPRPVGPIPLDASRDERAAVRRHAGQLAATLNSSDPEGALAVVTAIVRDVAGVTAPRRRETRTVQDQFDRCVVFPAAPEARQQLTRIVGMLQHRGPHPCSFDALVALVAITNCHAFADGNGRLSRILGNWLLFGRSADHAPYLPIREFAMFSRGGYIIRIRQAEMKDDWLDLALYILAIIRTWSRLNRI